MKNKRKLAASLTAGGIAAVVLLTGTFAWQSISQTGKNEMMGDPNPGGRLHDDFNGENKDIYVENFTDPMDGTPIFARIRLYEYMELGEGAGDPAADRTGDKIEVIGKTDAKFDDPTTWAIHHLDEKQESTAHMAFHDYVTWDQDGGSTVYMPTFNKNKDSLLIDQNGTLEGPDGLRPSDVGDGKDAYQNYKTYVVGQTATGNAIYDADDNPTDEVGDDLLPDGAGVKVDGSSSAVLGTDYTLTEETHTAQKTQDCTVITMAEWKALPDNQKVGNYWVYDTDGWAYWAAPIMPGTATGLLLDGVKMNQPDQEWYYAIDVVAQFSTAYDWGTKDKNDGFFGNGGMQDDGESVLDMAAESLNNKLTISLNNTVEDIATVDSFVAQPGDKARFSVTARINGVEKQLSSTELQDVKWNVIGGNVGTTRIDSTYTYSCNDGYGHEYDYSNNSALITLDEGIASGSTLTVTAEYKGMTDQVEVQVENLDYDDLDRVIPGSLTTVTIDGYEWYVLTQDGNQVLLWAAESLGLTQYGNSGDGYVLPWNTSNVRNYLNTTAWNNLGTLSKTGVAVPTTLYTWDGKGYDLGTNWVKTEDSIFLLTEADVFGTATEYVRWDASDGPILVSRQTKLEDYTYQIGGVGQILTPDVEMRRYAAAPFDGENQEIASILRHSCGKGNTAEKGIKTCHLNSGYFWISADFTFCAVRPAMWVNMGVDIAP